MAKSKILVQLVNNEITLDVALKRLMLICNDLNYEEIYNWAEKELEGYNNDDNVPEYRNLGSGIVLYSSLEDKANRRLQYSNHHMPIQWIPDEIKKYIVKNYERSSIQNIVNRANSKENFSRNLLNFAPYIKSEVEFAEIIQKFDCFAYSEIVNKISNILFKIFKKLDSEYGNLDSLDIDISKKEKTEIINIEKVLLSYVGELKYIQIGDNNKIKDSSIGENNEN